MIIHHLHALLKSKAKLLLSLIFIGQSVVTHWSRHVQKSFHGSDALLQVGNVHLQ
jgi:hypothetical protein